MGKINKQIRWCFLIVFFGCAQIACNHKPEDYKNSQPSIHAKNNNNTGKFDITPQIATALTYPKAGRGVGKFTIKGANNLHLTIPRKFLDFDPEIPNGEVETLLFVFYLPDWISREDAPPQSASPTESNQFRVSASIESIPVRYLSGCWAGRCLGQAYAIFQGEIEDFQTQKNRNEDSNQETHRCLNNGRFSPELGLVAYEGKLSIYTKKPDVIYLDKNADSCNPEKWLHCSGHACLEKRVESRAYFQYSYIRSLLDRHKEISIGFQKKISEFKHSDE